MTRIKIVTMNVPPTVPPINTSLYLDDDLKGRDVGEAETVSMSPDPVKSGGRIAIIDVELFTEVRMAW